MLSQRWWLVVVGAVVVASPSLSHAQDPDMMTGNPSSLNRVVVLPTRGTCGPGPKSVLEGSMSAAAQGLDPNRFQVLTLEAINAEMMNLGEDVKCGDDPCWMGILGKLGVAYSMRAECMDVAGDMFVTARFYNAKVGTVMASKELKGGNEEELKRLMDSQARRLVGDALDVKVAPNPLEPPQARDAPAKPGRSYVVFACEFPVHGPAADDGRKLAMAVDAAKTWAQQHNIGMVPIPQTFAVPVKSLGKECNLDSTFAKDLAARTKAAAVVWLIANDVKTVDGKVERYHVRVFARVYNARLGRFSRPINRTSARCEEPILADHGCLETYANTVAATLDGAEGFLALPDKEF